MFIIQENANEVTITRNRTISKIIFVAVATSFSAVAFIMLQRAPLNVAVVFILSVLISFLIVSLNRKKDEIKSLTIHWHSHTLTYQIPKKEPVSDTFQHIKISTDTRIKQGSKGSTFYLLTTNLTYENNEKSKTIQLCTDCENLEGIKLIRYLAAQPSKNPLSIDQTTQTLAETKTRISLWRGGFFLQLLWIFILMFIRIRHPAILTLGQTEKPWNYAIVFAPIIIVTTYFLFLNTQGELKPTVKELYRKLEKV